MDERIAFACEVMTRHRFSHQRIKEIMETYKVSERTARSYISKARAIFLKQLNKDRDKLVAEHANWLQGIIHDPAANLKNRLTAAKQLAMLCGLNAPVRVAVSADQAPLFNMKDVEGILSETESESAPEAEPPG